METSASKLFSPVKLKLTDELLKRTTSRCPVCYAQCPGEVWRKGGITPKVFLKRTCPEHGEASVCIASDARFYWLSKGKSENSCCGGGASVPASRASNGNGSSVASPHQNICCSADGTNIGTLGRNAEPGDALGVMEKLSTCLALIEIVHSCNLSCPTCYADSPLGVAQKVDAVPLDNLKRRIQGVIDRKGGIEILQLSGGEPTLHPQFFELLRWLQDHPKIDYVLLNTNGVRIAHDDAFARPRRGVPLRRAPALFAIRRHAGSRATISARRGLARDARALPRTLSRNESARHTCDDRDARKSAVSLGCD